jgi:hypothetical protein
VRLADSALVAPRPGALIADVSSEELEIDLLGASGDGELLVDPVRGAIIYYGIRETMALGADLGRASIHRTLNVRCEVERLGAAPADAR